MSNSDPAIVYLIKQAMLIDLKRHLREARKMRKRDFIGEELNSSEIERYYFLRKEYYSDRGIYEDNPKLQKRLLRKSSKSEEYL